MISCTVEIYFVLAYLVEACVCKTCVVLALVGGAFLGLAWVCKACEGVACMSMSCLGVAFLGLFAKLSPSLRPVPTSVRPFSSHSTHFHFFFKLVLLLTKVKTLLNARSDFVSIFYHYKQNRSGGVTWAGGHYG